MKVLQILVLMCGLVVSLNAQKASLSGTVTDKQGALIPNAKVEAKNLQGKIISARTNDGGQYQLELIEGEYNIEITLTPFDKFSLSNYWVIYKMQLDVALQCKNCEIIKHDLEPTQTIQTEKTKTSDNILQRPLEELPKKQNKTKRKINIINNE